MGMKGYERTGKRVRHRVLSLYLLNKDVCVPRGKVSFLSPKDPKVRTKLKEKKKKREPLVGHASKLHEMEGQLGQKGRFQALFGVVSMARLGSGAS